MPPKEFVRSTLATEVVVNGKVRRDLDWVTLTRSTGGRGDRATFRSKYPGIVQDEGLISSAVAAGGVAAIAANRAAAKSIMQPAEIEIRIKSGDDKEGGGDVLFWGITSGHTISIGGEKIGFEAGLPPFVFGEPLRGMPEKASGGDGEPYVNAVGHGNERGTNSLVFNPYVHSRAIGNMHPGKLGPGGSNLFLDDDGCRSENARKIQGLTTTTDKEFEKAASKRLWTLPEAVLTLCWLANPDETFIKNPDRKQLEKELKIVPLSAATTQGAGGVASVASNAAAEEAVGAELIRNVRISLGIYLGEALDRLLWPLGFSWCVEVKKGKRELRFWKRGEGEERTITIQRPYSQLDPEKSELLELDVDVSLASLVNQVRIVGAPNLIEGTFKLGKAWADDDDPDEGASDDYAKQGPKYLEGGRFERVLRDYVLNESTDYKHLSLKAVPPDKVFADIIRRHRKGPTSIVSRRRRFYPCLTLSKDGTPAGENGFLIEFDASKLSVAGAPNNGPEDWKPITECPYLGQIGQIDILQEECGIRFNGPQVPPEELTLRITCCVYDDERIEALSERESSSPQPYVVEQMLMDPMRFQYAAVDESSIHYEAVKSGSARAEQIDDRKAADRMAKRMREAGDQADIGGRIVLSGLTGNAYRLGDLVTGIPGRDIDFNARGSNRKVYPQIVSITLDNDTQRRTISIETQRG
jgi:hypothetical protein